MHVQIERMKPRELNAARDRFPVAYVPFGAIEFHGNHLPVGLDTLKCHRMLCRFAEQLGGLVAPPLFLGHGGGHLDFEWTWMADPDTLLKILLTTIFGLERNGFLVIVVMSGHYPNDKLFPELQSAYAEQGGKARLITLMEYDPFRAADEAHGDHASKWETSYMLALEAELVDLDRVRYSSDGRPLADFPKPAPNASGSWWFEKDPQHPWFGIAAAAGNAPVDATQAVGEAAIQRVLDWSKAKIDAALAEAGWTVDARR